MNPFTIDEETVSITVIPDGSDNYAAIKETDIGVYLETGMLGTPDISTHVFLTEDLRERLVALLTAVKL
jgi:hypothetical protein